ncbi:hypothetical protein SARC_08005 [Sphaeroforma arctica JP610]|uniref:MYND-type domain-containing protein n=1 Tax=Sphaeroforma arctica JP610 TaxID=667725 RepID=A0A0L0FSQ3_9EUKA|nr:hypothetical protein SARC_08005 [Sphaeroforma arctica JP610]KNC79606.1 hypothetical protein SARC_08005 [Sphaeroforma arctica JP610]|eukprot:XP_014153508.1 hypothetical protein SARC_08005 [Sphaeroforma arctica JP610]
MNTSTTIDTTPDKEGQVPGNAVIVGFVDDFAENEEKDLFPSKTGGKPEWLCMPHVPASALLMCPECDNPMCFLMQLYAPFDDKPEEAYHRTLYVFYCREKTCQTKQFEAQTAIHTQLQSHKHSLDNKSQNIEDDNTATSNEADEMLCTMRALRCQLPRDNQYYTDTDTPAHKPHSLLVPKLCIVCGARGDKVCGSCHDINYCSRAHQRLHWKRYGHSNTCTGKETPTTSTPKVQSPEDKQVIARTVLREMDIYSDEVVRAEADESDLDSSDESDEDEGASEGVSARVKSKRWEDYLLMVAELNAKRAREGMDPLDKEEIPFDDAKVYKDRAFLAFQREVKATGADQVLRYVLENHTNTVWVNADTMPPCTVTAIDGRDKLLSDAVPNCQRCGAARVLELQILPQMLYHLRLDDEWGLLSVYTCSQSCAPETQGEYSLEYVFRQDIGTTATYELPMGDAKVGSAKVANRGGNIASISESSTEA